jgi:biopolymer transport protein ExbD
MSFEVRHEGSPVSVDDLSAAEVAAGLLNGRWEPTDEVRDQARKDWVPLEDHSRFAEVASEIEPPPRKHHPDETRLDMNPLIDVALVLLIFFILTTTYETIRKVLDMPGSAKASGKLVTVTPDEAKKFTVMVTVRQESGLPAIKVEDQAVRLDELDAAVKRAVVSSKKTTLMIDATPDVDYEVVMAVQDAARGAGVAKVLWAQKKRPTGGSADRSR